MSYPTSTDKIYLSGPMSGIEGYNIKAFNMFAKHLRDLGFSVVNPAELTAELPGEPGSLPYEVYLKYDLVKLLECDSVVLMPGWKNSRGVRLELMIAATLKYNIYLINTDFTLKIFEGNGSYAVPIASEL